MAADRRGDGIDPGGDVGLAPRPEHADVAAEELERRLQAVGEVGGGRTGTGEGGRLGVEEAVDLVGERPDLDRNPGVEAARAA